MKTIVIGVGNLDNDIDNKPIPFDIPDNIEIIDLELTENNKHYIMYSEYVKEKLEKDLTNIMLNVNKKEDEN
jgi:hypothetical protein